MQPNSLLDALFQNSPHGLALLQDATLVAYNNAFIRLLGIESDPTHEQVARRLPLEEGQHPIEAETGNLLRLHVEAVTTEGNAGLLLTLKAEASLDELATFNLLDTLEDGIVLHAPDGRIRLCNRRAPEILGLTRDQLLGRDALDPRWQTIHEDGSPFPGETHPVSITLQTGQAVTGQVMGVMRPDEHVSWILINANPTREGGVIVSFTDITRQKRIEAALRESEERFRTLVSSTDDIVYTLDTEQRYTAVYGQWIEQLGLTAADYIGRTSEEILGEEASPAHWAANERALSGETATYEWSVAGPDGMRQYQTVVSPIRNTQGQVTGLVGVGRDITVLKNSERAAHAYAQRVNALRDSAEALIRPLTMDDVMDHILDNADSVIAFDAALLLVYIDEEQRIERRTTDGLPPIPDRGWPDWAVSTISETIVLGGVQLGELRLASRARNSFNELGSLQAFCVQAAGAIHNAMLYEHLETYAHRLEDIVATRTAQLKEAYERLSHLDELKDIFLANVSHELRTPVTNIKLYHHLLSRRPEKAEQYMEILKRETARLQYIIDELLYAAQIEAGTMEITWEPVDLAEAAQHVIDYHTPPEEDAEQSRIALDVPQRPVIVTGSKKLVVRLIDILLTNAITYTPDGGHISVQLGVEDGKTAVLEVRDSGPGIPTEELPLIFERFYRGQAGQNSGLPGTGMGLPIAQGIVQQHGGEIEVYNADNGAVFVVSLPLEQARHKREAS